MYTFIRKNKKYRKNLEIFWNVIIYVKVPVLTAALPCGFACRNSLPGRRLTMGGDGAILFKITCVGNERSRG